jgi:hypothetical protein
MKIAAFLTTLAVALPAAAQSPPQAYQGLNAIAIPYANGAIALERVPQIWIRLAGSKPERFGMDTGSTGIVVSTEGYTPAKGDVSGGPGQLTYNSSGRVLHGTYWTTDVEIMQSQTEAAATARVQVLRVESISCQQKARDCQPNPHPTGVAFMGIGFDRDSAQGTQPTVERNPFVALTKIASGMPLKSVRPGYIVSRDGIHLGMTPELTSAFAFVKLTPTGSTDASGRPVWGTPALTVTVDGVTGTGTCLMDTGINYMFLTPPNGSTLAHGKPAPNGTKIAIWLPGQKPPYASYAVTVGETANPMTPAKVEVVHDPAVFVNTGRMFLQGFDYLYDAVGGYVGYASTNPQYAKVATGR